MIPRFKGLVDRLLNVAIPTFGESITYYPYGGKPSYKFKAVFDREHLFIDPDTKTVVASNSPRVGVNLNNMFEKPLQGDVVKIADELFAVDDCQEDGQGGASLVLRRINDVKEAKINS